MGSVKIPFFRLWYSTAFVILFLITLIFTLISPGDIIYQLIRASKLRDVVSVAGVYVVTSLVCLFIWASRIYTNRVVLRDIPKAYVPIEAGEVPRKVRRLIEKQWRRSAVVAWDSRPRDVTEEMANEHEDAEGRRRLFHLRKSHAKNATIIPPKTAAQAWGHITHPGWSVPSESSATNGQSVQYWTVIVELPHLLEAKAVSLVPPVIQSDEDEQEPQPDPRLVSLLERRPNMGLRDYVSYLLSMGLLAPSEKVNEFIDQYEYARFSARALTTQQFDELMASFAAILSIMSLDMEQISTLLDDFDTDTEPSLRSVADSEDDNTESFNRPSMDSDLSGSVQRHITVERSDSPSAPSESSVIIHSPRRSFSDT
jgi:hypothetical protein